MIRVFLFLRAGIALVFLATFLFPPMFFMFFFVRSFFYVCCAVIFQFPDKVTLSFDVIELSQPGNSKRGGGRKEKGKRNFLQFFACLVCFLDFFAVIPRCSCRMILSFFFSCEIEESSMRKGGAEKERQTDWCLTIFGPSHRDDCLKVICPKRDHRSRSSSSSEQEQSKCVCLLLVWLVMLWLRSGGVGYLFCLLCGGLC